MQARDSMQADEAAQTLKWRFRVDKYAEQLNQLLSEDLGSVRLRERAAFDQLLAEADGRVVLFGAGNLGRKALRCLRGVGVEPLAFTDNNPASWGTSTDGIPVLSPAEAAEKYGRTALFVVTIWSLGHSFRQTQEQLSRLGCRHVVGSSPLRWKFAEQLLPDFCQDLPHKVYEQADEVRAAASVWADDYSRQEYLNHLKWRALGDLGALEPPDTEASYFLDSLYSIIPGEVYVDCGAYDGDTAKEVLQRRLDIGSFFAIEADPANFRALKQWTSTLDPETARRILPCNVAVGASRGQLRFNATGGEGACIDEDGDVVVDCVPIDELAGESKPTFIKMDIEGFEMDALEGARGVIQKYQPILSICVYHRQSDLWRVPLFIRSLVKDYRMFLRPHDVDGWQLVCYAVPPDRLRKNERGPEA
jgi:FkbM family methyltransferase